MALQVKPLLSIKTTQSGTDPGCVPKVLNEEGTQVKVLGEKPKSPTSVNYVPVYLKSTRKLIRKLIRNNKGAL